MHRFHILTPWAPGRSSRKKPAEMLDSVAFRFRMIGSCPIGLLEAQPLKIRLSNFASFSLLKTIFLFVLFALIQMDRRPCF